MNEPIVINGILYLVSTASDLYDQFGIEIDAEVGLVYAGPKTGVFTDEVVEVPESGTYNGQTVPVVGFAGGYVILMSGNETAAASVSEVILPSSILFLIYGFSFFTNLQKVTCYAESTPKLSSEIGGPTGIDFEGTPSTKELYIPVGSDYSTWESATTWESVNEIYDGFVEIVDGLKYKETGETTVALIGYEEGFTATSITIPSSITHEGNAYTVTEIKNAFKNYTGLTSVTIPDSVTTIGYSAFYGCTGLTSIDIPNSVTTIGNYAFGYCSGLTSIDIPNSVTTIGNYAFSNTQGESIDTVIDNLNITLIDSYTCEINGLVTLLNVKNITFNYNNTSYNCNFGYTGKFGDYSNQNNTSLTGELNLNNIYYEGIKVSVTSIGTYAFQNCRGLTTVTIPDGVTTIGYSAFYNCRGLTTVTIPDGVTSIGYEAFSGCSSLTSVTIPDNVTTIGEQAFRGCSGLTSITIPDSVTTIETYAFYGCSSLTSVTIPDSVTSIGQYAFYNVIHIEYHGPATGSPWGAYSMNGYVEGDWVYSDETKTILNRYMGGATSVIIPNSVTSIGSSAFMGCSSLTSVTIPNSVTSIGYYTFAWCSSLTSIYLLKPTAPNFDTSSFANTPSTKVLFVPIGATGYSTSWGNTTWSAVNYTMVPTNDVNYKLNDTNTIETFNSNNKSETLTIPSTVTYNNNTYSVDKVTRNSLANDNKIKTLTINSGINKIEASALSGCNNLETVNIPESVSEIDNHAFWMCRNLKNIVLPSNLTKLKPEMFVACEELQEITIPEGITTIPFRMFEGCRNLTTVNLPDTITEIQWSAFKDCKSLTTINKPDGCYVDPTAFEGTTITV